ncbi:MAG TPA: DNA polymerase IV [Nitrososphaeraceae archaeon]|nr:DNA polymerase IV [Nitrososphaeraceae archaeon]
MRYYVSYSGLNSLVISEQYQQNGDEDKDKIKQLLSYSSNLYPNDNNSPYYSEFFNLIEINFFPNHRYTEVYNTNNFLTDIIKKQILQLNDFKFSILVPKQIIDQKNKENDNKKLEKFLEELKSLKEKILTIVLQIPWTRILSENKEWLDSILWRCCIYYGYSVAIEFDHPSWYQDLTYNILKKYNVSLIWSDRHRYHTVFTSNFLYLRINENLDKWIKKLKEKEVEEKNNEIKALKKGKNSFVFDHNIIDFAVIVVESNNLSKINFILKSLELPQLKNEIKKNNNIITNKKQWIGKAIFHVDINSFFSSCEEIRDPSLKGKSHAVIMTDQDNNNITKGVVATCSYEAKKLGIRSAMPLYKSLELCPNLILHAVDKKFYNNISDTVMEILEGYADIFEQASIDEAYLDCTNKFSSNTNTITVEEYAQEIKKSIKEKCGGLLTSIGISTTKSIAKIASDYQKPNGLTVVTLNELKKFLNPLEVERISGIGIKTQKILKEEMKIKTIGELAKTDVQILIERFGKKIGTWMWQVANGEDNDPVIPRGDHISISNESTLEYFTLDREIIKQSLYELIDELFERIKNNNYQFRTVGIKLVRTDFSIETREKSYTNYQSERKSIESIIEELLNRFILEDNQLLSSTATTNPKKTITKKILYIRKIGLRLSNLITIDNNKNIQYRQTTLLDYF